MSDKPKSSRPPIVKLGVFAGVMILILAGLIVVFSEFRSSSTEGFQADFADVSGLENGDKVRIAGVEVGRVRSIDLEPGNIARVEFTVDGDQAVHRSTNASVRYANLTGDRYLELSRGEGDMSLLEPGETLPIEQTHPALDLDALLGGFRPLFRALDPDQVNKLSASIIQVFQGESGNVQDLLAATSSLTTTLANRDELIGDVITNLNRTLETVNDNRQGVESIVDNLQQLISGLAENAGPIGESVDRINTASSSMSELLVDLRPPLRENVEQIDRVAGLVNEDEEYVESVMQRLPDDFQKMSRLGAYGGFFNFYLCGVILRFSTPMDPENEMFLSQFEQKDGRCSM